MIKILRLETLRVVIWDSYSKEGRNYLKVIENYERFVVVNLSNLLHVIKMFRSEMDNNNK